MPRLTARAMPLEERPRPVRRGVCRHLSFLHVRDAVLLPTGRLELCQRKGRGGPWPRAVGTTPFPACRPRRRRWLPKYQLHGVNKRGGWVQPTATIESRALARDEQSRCRHNPVPGVPAEEKTLAGEVTLPGVNKRAG